LSLKGVDNQLFQYYGLPDHSNHVYIASSTSGYMNEELFNIYLDEVFIPGVDNLRKIKTIPTAWAGLAMDQFSGHT